MVNAASSRTIRAWSPAASVFLQPLLPNLLLHQDILQLFFVRLATSTDRSRQFAMADELEQAVRRT